jgi:Ion channel
LRTWTRLAGVGEARQAARPPAAELLRPEPGRTSDFGVAYGAIQEISEEPFFATGTGQRDDFLYFSYATLTTVGYGDLIAAHDVGRSLAITEALVGQIYLVTVVAVIVSNLRPARSCSRRRQAE